MSYVPAIDGLRAISVGLVLLFHAKLPLATGGFVGVDVFFVISGYLITRIILEQHAEGRFSLCDFYVHRIRRLFPALFLVLFATMAIGAVVMLPPDIVRLSSSVSATALFAANFYFWRERLNYLQDNPDLEPLLHTWSLAIEEQFYVLFPILLLALLRLFGNPSLALIGLGIASFALSVELSTTHPFAAFYFSLSRAWELLLGAWLAASKLRDFVPGRFIPTLQGVGVVMIGAAAVSYDRLTSFPGFAALLPCFGAAVLIAWSHLPSRLVATLSHPALVWVGVISYPLYLWHLPLLVLARLSLLQEPAPHVIALLYLTAFVLAAITWRFVEKPIRACRGSSSARHVFTAATAITVLAITVGTGLRLAQGLTEPPTNVAHILAAAKDFAPSRAACHNWDRQSRDQFADCVMGDKSQPGFDFALWGDSHAGAVAGVVDTVGRDISLKGLQLTSDDCLPVLGVNVVLGGAVTDCAARNEATYVLLTEHRVRQVVMEGAWFQYLGTDGKSLRLSNGTDTGLQSSEVLSRQMTQTIRRLQRSGIAVTIVGPVPYIGWNVPSVLAARASRGILPREGPRFSDFAEHQRQTLAILREAEANGATIVYPHERLCQLTCLVRLDDQILYSDDEHLTTAGATILQPMFMGELGRLARRSK
jgi:peptidoglycan/LPS O-acetylase OafA/YrhL